MPVGCLVAFVLPNLFFDADKEIEKSDFEFYIIIQTVIVATLCAPSIIFLKEEPPSPPTVLLKDKDSIIQMSMGDAIKSLFKNRNYIYMFICFNSLYGLYCAISGVMAAFTDYYKYTSSEISIVCLMFSISGILNSFFIGTLLDKYQCYRKALLTLCVASMISFALCLVGIPSKKVGIAGGVMVLTGASMIPIVPICFSFAAELSYPVPESYSIGLMISTAQILGFLLVRNYNHKNFRDLDFLLSAVQPSQSME